MGQRVARRVVVLPAGFGLCRLQTAGAKIGDTK